MKKIDYDNGKMMGASDFLDNQERCECGHTLSIHWEVFGMGKGCKLFHEDKKCTGFKERKS